MSILAFDTTMNACAIAVWRDGASLARQIVDMKHGQAEALVPLVEKVLAESGQGYQDIERIAVTTGPGSFTGVRVGLATARGLGLALSCPVVGISTPEVLAATAFRLRGDVAEEPVAVAIDARRAEIYLQIFDLHGQPAIPPVCVLPADATQLIPAGRLCLTGDAADRLAEHLKVRAHVIGQRHAEPEDLAALGQSRDPLTAPAAPLYVRPPDAAMPPQGGRLRP